MLSQAISHVVTVFQTEYQQQIVPTLVSNSFDSIKTYVQDKTPMFHQLRNYRVLLSACLIRERPLC